MFPIGADVFVKDPQRFVPGCACIVGPITDVRQENGQTVYALDAYVGVIGGGGPARLDFVEADIATRGGTPISELSGRPGHSGYERFVAISQSWGYP